MSLKAKCQEAKDKVLEKWLADFFKHYGIDAQGVSRTVDDRFMNPVGFVVKNATKILFSAVIGEEIEREEVQKQVYELMRIQAIQQLSPAQAHLPFIALKEHLFQLLNSDLNGKENFLEFKTMTDRVDTLMLMAFDVFMQDKEVLYRVRVQELKNAQAQILRFAQSKGYPAS